MFKQDLFVRTGLMNAAGMLGFAPSRRSGFELARLDGFVTNPISLLPRHAAEGRCMISFAGGFLLHSGWPNPGFQAVLRQHAAQWRSAPLPVWVHLLADRPEDIAAMTGRLEGLENVAGVEVGLPPQVESGLARQMIEAAAGELGVIARLPFERALELALALKDVPLSAFSLGPARGCLSGTGDRLVHGRLYGPAQLPAALSLVQALAKAGMRIIGAGGVYSAAAAVAMRQAGATAVQLDAVLWKGLWK